MKNRYARSAKISERKIRKVVRYFAADLTALQAAALSGLNRNTINRPYRALRYPSRRRAHLA
jgi:transposase